MGLRDDLREHVWKRFVDKCSYRMKYGGYNKYLTTKGFGTRLLSLIIVEVIVFILLAAKYGYISGFINDLFLVFLAIDIVYSIASLTRYEVEESEAREKLGQLCSDLGGVAADIAIETIEKTLIDALEEALDKDYDRVSALVHRKKEIEHILRNTSDKHIRRRLEKYLRKVDEELTQAINEALHGKHLDTQIIKKLLEEITS